MIKLLKNLSEDNAGYKIFEKVKLPVKYKWEIKSNQKIKFIEVDFNSPLFGSFWIKPEFSDCIFSKCNLDGVNAVKTTFKNCTFDKSSMGKKLFNSFSKCTFLNCKFHDCTFKNVEIRKTTFEKVVFMKSKLIRVNFYECTLTDFVFNGKLRTVNNIKSTAKKVDLGASYIVDSSLVDGPNQEIFLPDKLKNFVAFPKGFRMVKDALEGKISDKSFIELCDIVDFVSGSEFGEIVDEELFIAIPGAERDIIMNKLYELRKYR